MDQGILGELIQIGQQERARQEGMEHDKNIRILNAVLNNQRLDKQANINEEATIFELSLDLNNESFNQDPDDDDDNQMEIQLEYSGGDAGLNPVTGGSF